MKAGFLPFLLSQGSLPSTHRRIKSSTGVPVHTEYGQEDLNFIHVHKHSNTSHTSPLTPKQSFISIQVKPKLSSKKLNTLEKKMMKKATTVNIEGTGFSSQRKSRAVNSMNITPHQYNTLSCDQDLPNFKSTIYNSAKTLSIPNCQNCKESYSSLDVRHMKSKRKKHLPNTVSLIRAYTSASSPRHSSRHFYSVRRNPSSDDSHKIHKISNKGVDSILKDVVGSEGLAATATNLNNAIKSNMLMKDGIKKKANSWKEKIKEQEAEWFQYLEGEQEKDDDTNPVGSIRKIRRQMQKSFKIRNYYVQQNKDGVKKVFSSYKEPVPEPSEQESLPYPSVKKIISEKEDEIMRKRHNRIQNRNSSRRGKLSREKTFLQRILDSEKEEEIKMEKKQKKEEKNIFKILDSDQFTFHEAIQKNTGNPLSRSESSSPSRRTFTRQSIWNSSKAGSPKKIESRPTTTLEKRYNFTDIVEDSQDPKSVVVQEAVNCRKTILEQMYKIISKSSGSSLKKEFADYALKNLIHLDTKKLDEEVNHQTKLRIPSGYVLKAFQKKDKLITEVSNSSKNSNPQRSQSVCQKDLQPNAIRERIKLYGRWYLKSNQFNRKLMPQEEKDSSSKSGL